MASTEPQAARSQISTSGKSEHPSQHTTSLIEVIPQGIDIEEEAQLYEQLCDVSNWTSSLLSSI